MINTNRGNVHIEGMTVEIMSDFRAICSATKKMFVKELGEEAGKELYEALLIEDSKESASKVLKAIRTSNEKEPVEEETNEEESTGKEPTTGNPLLDAILTAVFGGGAA